MEFLPSNPGQIGAIAELLQRSFHVGPDDSSVDLSYLNWKYYAEGPSWPGSRSYIVQSREGEILAHAAIWPVELRLRGGIRHGFGFGDWASSEQHRGAGLLLLRRLMKLASFVLVTGGKEITQQILPRAGFERWADRPTYVKILRPFRKTFRGRSTLDWKAPARLTRNLVWSVSSTASAHGWTAQETVPDGQWLAPTHEQLGPVHSPEFLRYLLRCPTAAFRFLSLHEDGVLKGYSIVSFVGAQARLADLRLVPGGTSASGWSAAVAAVVRFVAQHPQISEVMTLGSTSELGLALIDNGFHLQSRVPLVVFDTRKEIAQEPVPQLGMLEDDAAVV